jgi:type IV secretory pathway TraG/TraD family ATPase VirD4
VLLEFRHVIQIDLDPSELGFVRWREIEESGTVVFVSLDVMNPTSALLGSSILESFTAYKRSCTVRGENDFDAAILIDEFQRMVSPQLAESLAGMRKHRTFFYLLAQHISQIRQVSEHLAETLLAQIGVQIFMSPETEEEQKYIQQFSELVIRTLGSITCSITNPTTGERDFQERRLTINEIRAVAQTPNCAVLLNRMKRGVEEPSLIYLEHLITPEVHAFLSGRPIPKKLPAPVVPELEQQLPADPAPQDDVARMREMFERVGAWLAGN